MSLNKQSTDNFNQKQQIFNNTIELRKTIDLLSKIYVNIADWFNNDNIKTLEEAKNIKKNIFQFNKNIERLITNNYTTKYITNNEKKKLEFLLEKFNNWSLDKIIPSIDDTILFLEEIKSFSISNHVIKLFEKELKSIMWEKKYNTNRY